MSTTVQCEIVQLLIELRTHVYGNRFDCPDCGGKGTGSIYAGWTRVKCHHAGCEFHGGIGFLRQRLGKEREWLPKRDYIGQQRVREQANDALRRLDHKVRSRRREVLDVLSELATNGRLVPERVSDDDAVWEWLQLVSEFRPGLLAELAILENASAPALVRFLTADDEIRDAEFDRVILAGGIYDAEGKFVNVNW